MSKNQKSELKKTMSIAVARSYTGSLIRMQFIFDELKNKIPELKNNNLMCDGCTIWGKNIYISDGLFLVRIFTPKKAYEYTQTNGLVKRRNFWKKLIKNAKDALNGINNSFTKERAETFLKLNS